MIIVSSRVRPHSRLSGALSVSCLFIAASLCAAAEKDPGPRTGDPSAGGALQNLTPAEYAAYNSGKLAFQETDSVSGTLSEGAGLGPGFNMDSCGGCHSQPGIGGSSPAVNPQIAVATKAGATNRVPPFISASGPVREARFVRNGNGGPDGGVHDLFVITGRSDAGHCNAVQPDFAAALAANNVSFRIPTPTFGNGLVEAIDDAVIMANKDANLQLKKSLGISGHENRNPNDGSLTRFGWKAQNKSLMIFSGEAYNVEQGVTNDLFPNERDSSTGCRLNATPEDHFNVNEPASGDLVAFTMFMRFLAPPTRGPSDDSVVNGASLFNTIGCALCHTPSLPTGSNTTAALSNKTADLFSDLLVHHMGDGLADGISQGSAGPDEFRTAPLWGLGQRLFFLHDGRASDLNAAIAAHAGKVSEANAVFSAYDALKEPQKNDILRFLRSL
jgi:CxxC motif-containing protein (DUF1111 family)